MVTTTGISIIHWCLWQIPETTANSMDRASDLFSYGSWEWIMPQSSKWIHISPIYGSWLWQTNMDLPFFEISHIFIKRACPMYHATRLESKPKYLSWSEKTHGKTLQWIRDLLQLIETASHLWWHLIRIPRAPRLGEWEKQLMVNTVDCDPWNGEDRWKWVDQYPPVI